MSRARAIAAACVVSILAVASAGAQTGPAVMDSDAALVQQRLLAMKDRVEEAASSSLASGMAPANLVLDGQVHTQWALLVQEQLLQASTRRTDLQNSCQQLVHENRALRQQLAKETPGHLAVGGDAQPHQDVPCPKRC